MPRILVTGVHSCSGRHFVRALQDDDRDWEIWGTDQTEAASSAVTCRTADIADPDALRRVVREAAPDSVVHLAAAVSSDRDVCYRVNLQGTLGLLDACASLAKPPHLTLVSSSAVYGLTDSGQGKVREITPLRPLSYYGASKAAAEIAALTAHRAGRMPVTVARPFNLVGPGLRPGLAPADFMLRAKAIRDGHAPGTLQVGYLEPRRDFVDVRDAARAYLLLAAHPERSGAAYNVASGKATAIGDLLAAVLDVCGVTADIQTDERLQRTVDVIEQVGDATLLNRDTGWTPRVDLKTSLRDML